MTPRQEYGPGASLRRLAPLSAMAAGIAWTFCLTILLLFLPTVSPQRVIQGGSPAQVETDLTSRVTMTLLSVTFILVAVALAGILQHARSSGLHLFKLGVTTMLLAWLLITIAWPVFITAIAISIIGNAEGRVLSTLSMALLLLGSIGGVLILNWEEPLERFTGLADPLYLVAALFGWHGLSSVGTLPLRYPPDLDQESRVGRRQLDRTCEAAADRVTMNDRGVTLRRTAALILDGLAVTFLGFAVSRGTDFYYAILHDFDRRGSAAYVLGGTLLPGSQS